MKTVLEQGLKHLWQSFFKECPATQVVPASKASTELPAAVSVSPMRAVQGV